MGPAWYSHNTEFDQKEEWNANQPVKVKVGINAGGFITISTLSDDAGEWKLHARSSYPVPEGSEFRLGIKLSTTGARLRTQPKVHLLEEEAPTMYFRYIESPDGTFHYPLFATEEEANYYDEQNGGSGQSHTHVYRDDPTNTTWYMPETNSVHDGTSAPVTDLTLGEPGNYTEITSLTDSDLTPPQFQDTTITVDELSAVVYQLSPVDVDYVTTIGGIPNWQLQDGTTLTGTAPEVTGDNVSNPSDTTTVTVYRTRNGMTSQGTLTINITNLTAPVTPITGVTFEGGSPLIDSDTLADGSSVSIDNEVNVGNRFVIDKDFVDNYILPKITSGTGTKRVFIGFAVSSPDWSGVGPSDFELCYEFFYDGNNRSNNNWRLRVHNNGSQIHNVGVGSLTSGLYDFVLINDGEFLRLGSLVESQGHNPTTTVFEINSPWNFTSERTVSSSNRKIFIATEGTQLDISLSDFSEVTEPTAPTTLTNWTKALDFSGSSERAQMVSSNASNQPIAQNFGVTVTAPANSSYTTAYSSGKPWATAIVFSPDYNNSNQHIWNQGEGSGSSGDNIYLRLASDRRLYFGWGRSGALNELYLGTLNPNIAWYGCYIGFNGTRLSAANATPANLADCFDVRLLHSGNNFTMSTYEWSNDGVGTGWNSSFSTTGGRMDRSVTGSFTIGGRGANRNFHGKVASFVATTLKLNTSMPSNAEIEMMIKDPQQWVQDYKVGQSYRRTYSSSNSTNFQIYNTSGLHYPSNATQVYLMGDGPNDSYSNMIRNQINMGDQNYTKLNLISMVSNDIQNVNINGLT